MGIPNQKCPNCGEMTYTISILGDECENCEVTSA